MYCQHLITSVAYRVSRIEDHPMYKVACFENSTRTWALSGFRHGEHRPAVGDYLVEPPHRIHGSFVSEKVFNEEYQVL